MITHKLSANMEYRQYVSPVLIVGRKKGVGSWNWKKIEKFCNRNSTIWDKNHTKSDWGAWNKRQGEWNLQTPFPPLDCSMKCVSSTRETNIPGKQIFKVK